MKTDADELGAYRVREHAQKDHSKAYVMGTSVLGIKYSSGIMLASDTQLSYGSYAKFKHIQRAAKITENTALVSSGEYSNFQELVHQLRVEVTPLPGEDALFGPRECFEIVKSHMYAKRCKGAPEMNTHIIAGIESAEKRTLPYEGDESGFFLASVDHLGGFYHSDIVATGIGAHIALPILRSRVQRASSLTEQEAEEILSTAMRALVYRDTRASSRIQMTKVTRQGVEISEPIHLDTSWEVGR